MLALKLTVDPAQTGLGVAVAVGAEGSALTVTVTTPGMLEHVVTVLVTTTEYVPALAADTLVMDGFCWVEVKLFGPVHEYVKVPLLAVRSSWLPTQSGFTSAEAAG